MPLCSSQGHGSERSAGELVESAPTSTADGHSSSQSHSNFGGGGFGGGGGGALGWVPCLIYPKDHLFKEGNRRIETLDGRFTATPNSKWLEVSLGADKGGDVG